MVTERSQVYGQNRSALQRVQPDLARVVDESVIPDSIRWVEGRDGTPTAQLDPTDTHCRWLAGSSMPTISAAATLRAVQDTGSSVLLPRVGTGLEALHLTQRLAAHCGVFVFEPDAWRIKLVLHLHDYSQSLQARRVIFLTGPALEPAIVECLAANEGFDFPQRLILPWNLNPGQHETLQTELRRAGHAVEESRRRRLHTLSTQLASERPREPAEATRVAVVTIDARPRSMFRAETISTALATLGCDVVTCIPRTPDRCSLLARATAIVQHRPDLVLMLNGTSGHLADVLPPHVAVASWLWPDALLPAGQTLLTTPSEHLFVADEQRLKQTSDQLAAETVSPVLLEVAPLEITGADPDDRSHPDDAGSCQVAVFADLADLEAEAVGVTQATHRILWESLCSLVQERFDDWSPSLGPELLRLAERRTKVELQENDLRQQFLKLLVERVAPTCVARGIARSLVRSGLAVGIWGTGWAEDASLASAYRGVISDMDQRHRVYQHVRAVVFPNRSVECVADGLSAVVAGALPLFRRVTAPLCDAHPQLHHVLELLPSFESAEKAVELARRAVQDSTYRIETVERARECIRAGHSLADRLQQILNTCCPTRG